MPLKLTKKVLRKTSNPVSLQIKKRQTLTKSTIPLELLNLARKNPSFRKMTIGCNYFREHTIDAIRNAIQLKHRLPKKLQHAFVATMIVHDVGKMRAMSPEGKREMQQEYTVDILKKTKILESLGINSNEKKLVLALVESDSIGLFLQQKINFAQAIKQIKDSAQKSQIPFKQFVSMLELFYICDVGAHESLRGRLINQEWKIAAPDYSELKKRLLNLK